MSAEGLRNIQPYLGAYLADWYRVVMWGPTNKRWGIHEVYVLAMTPMLTQKYLLHTDMALLHVPRYCQSLQASPAAGYQDMGQ